MAALANKQGNLQLPGRGCLDAILKGFVVPQQIGTEGTHGQAAMSSMNRGWGGGSTECGAG